MKVLIISTGYHPALGGVETQTRMLAHELAEQHDVDIAASRFHNNKSKRFPEIEDCLFVAPHGSHSDGSVTVHSLTPSALDRLRLMPVLIRALGKVHKTAAPALRRHAYRYYQSVYIPKLRSLIKGKDIVHSTAFDYFGWAAAEAARAENVPFVVSSYVHPGQWNDSPEDLSCYRNADRVFALLDTDRENLVNLGIPAERIRISGVVPLLPGTVDPDGFRARHGLCDQKVVLFVGRHVEYKGPKTLLESTKRVWDEMPDVRFVFIGSAPAYALRWFDAHKDSRIHYLGNVSEQEKADALAACDVFCMPSDHEILPAVYLEAWSFAKPVIGGSAHGLRELIEGNRAGVTIERHPETIARSLISLFKDETGRNQMGLNGRELVERRYSRKAVLGAVTQTYREVIHE